MIEDRLEEKAAGTLSASRAAAGEAVGLLRDITTVGYAIVNPKPTDYDQWMNFSR